jgi:hypothetical protein
MLFNTTVGIASVSVNIVSVIAGLGRVNIQVAASRTLCASSKVIFAAPVLSLFKFAQAITSVSVVQISIVALFPSNNNIMQTVAAARAHARLGAALADIPGTDRQTVERAPHLAVTHFSVLDNVVAAVLELRRLRVSKRNIAGLDKTVHRATVSVGIVSIVARLLAFNEPVSAQIAHGFAGCADAALVVGLEETGRRASVSRNIVGIVALFSVVDNSVSAAEAVGFRSASVSRGDLA